MIQSFINRRLSYESNISLARNLANMVSAFKSTENDAANIKLLSLLREIEKANAYFGNSYIASTVNNIIQSYNINSRFELEEIRTLLELMDNNKYVLFGVIDKNVLNIPEELTWYLTTPNAILDNKTSNFLKKIKRSLGFNTLSFQDETILHKLIEHIKSFLFSNNFNDYDYLFLKILEDRLSLVETFKDKDSINIGALEDAYNLLLSQTETERVDSRVWSTILWHCNKHPTEFALLNGFSKEEFDEKFAESLSNTKIFTLIRENKPLISWPSWQALEHDFISLSEIFSKPVINWSNVKSHLNHIKSKYFEGKHDWDPVIFFEKMADYLSVNISAYLKYRENIVIKLGMWKESLLKRDPLEAIYWQIHAKKHQDNYVAWFEEHIDIKPTNENILSELSKELYVKSEKRLDLLVALGFEDFSKFIKDKEDLSIQELTILDNGIFVSQFEQKLYKEFLYMVLSTDLKSERRDIMENNLEANKENIAITDYTEDTNIELKQAILADAKDMASLLQESIIVCYKNKLCDECFMRAVHSLKSLSLSMEDSLSASYFAKLELWSSALIEKATKLTSKEFNIISLSMAFAMLAIDAWDNGKLSESVATSIFEDSFESKSMSEFSISDGLVDENAYENEVDEIDINILEHFNEEAQEIFNKLDECLIGNISGNIETINALLHTLKGGARISGLMKLGSWVHQLEDLTTKRISGLNNEKLHNVLQKSFDKCREIFSSSIAEFQRTSEDSGKESMLKISVRELEEISNSLLISESNQKKISSTISDLNVILLNSKEPIRRLKKLASDIYIEAESLLNSGSSKKRNNALFDELEFDKFTYFHELTRKLEEAVSDNNLYSELIESNIGYVADFTDKSKTWVNSAQKELLKNLYKEANYFEPRLLATVRSASSELKKDVGIVFEGSSLWVDKKILDEVSPALEHLVRNCIAHSIELPEQRLLDKKPRKAKITVSSTSTGDKFRFSVKDDGFGMNFDIIKQRALSKNLIKDPNVTKEDLCKVIFEPGFTTATSVNNTAGRGVGLDAVDTMIKSLKGTIEIKLFDNNKPEFVIEVPMSAWLLSGVKVTANGKPYVIDGSYVENVLTISSDVVKNSLSEKTVKIENEDLPIIYLDYFNNNFEIQKLNRFHPLVRLTNGKTIVGDSVEFIEKQPIRPLPFNLYRNEGVLGTTILSDSSVGVVVDPTVTKWDSLYGSTLSSNTESHIVNKNLIMVVDDSLTIRKVSEKFLRKNGYDFISAENGLEAIKYLENNILPGFILMDIEMPVMDGFEAIKRIKQTEHTKDIPVIFISSRAVDKHINYAKSIGALNFLGKPFNEDKLLAILSGNYVGNESEVV